jgi:hypothetical protein
MIQAIIAFILLALGSLAPGIADGFSVPGLASLPDVVAERGASDTGLEHSQRPGELPVGEGAGNAQQGKPADVPRGEQGAGNGNAQYGKPADLPPTGGNGGGQQGAPVDTSGAPQVIDLSGVPAAEQSNVPTVITLPEQAGGGQGGPPVEKPGGGPASIPAQASGTASCATADGCAPQSQ